MSAYVRQTLTVLKINPITLSVGGSCWDYLFLFREEPNHSGIK